MAADDTTILNPGAGGDAIAQDDISGVIYQIIKIGHGPDGSQPVHTGPATPLPIGDPMLDIARGLVTGIDHANKFGVTLDADVGVLTDLWDNSATTRVWVAPTQARTHQIKSSDAGDDGSPVGVGARTIRIWGLKTWSLAETSEDIIMNGTTDVPTANTYVIIHRMRVLTKGGTNSNVGVITATADTDNGITAQINAGLGQTEMAILGIPDTQVAYVTGWRTSSLKATTALTAEIDLLFNPEPNAELLHFLIKDNLGLETAGTSHAAHNFRPYLKLAGPGIIKLRANADKANSVISGGMDVIRVNN